MKRIVFITFLAVISIFGFSTYFSACKQDACVTRNVECKNNGTCKDGDCICAAGYEGDSCQFKVNEKFLSNYACSARTRLINDTIEEDNDDTLRIISGGDKFSIKIYSIRDSVYEIINGTVNGNYITIKDQTKELANNIVYNYNGSGSLNNGVLTVTLNKTKVTVPQDWHSKTTYVAYKYE